MWLFYWWKALYKCVLLLLSMPFYFVYLCRSRSLTRHPSFDVGSKRVIPVVVKKEAIKKPKVNIMYYIILIIFLFLYEYFPVNVYIYILQFTICLCFCNKELNWNKIKYPITSELFYVTHRKRRKKWRRNLKVRITLV